MFHPQFASNSPKRKKTRRRFLFLKSLINKTTVVLHGISITHLDHAFSQLKHSNFYEEESTDSLLLIPMI